MVVLLSIVILLAVSIVLYIWNNNSWFSDSVEFISIVMIAISTILLIGSLILIPIFHYNGKAEVERYYALQNTIEKSREEGLSEVERAALTTEIAEYNKDLASVKYWNNTIFDWWHYDGLAELDYLE